MKLSNNKNVVNPVRADSVNINWNKLLLHTKISTYASAATASTSWLNVAKMPSAAVAVPQIAVAKATGGQPSRTSMPWYSIFPKGAESSLAGLELFKTERDLTKFEPAHVNISSLLIMGFGLIALWVGLICFTVNTFTSIGAESKSSDSSSYSSPTTLDIALFER